MSLNPHPRPSCTVDCFGCKLRSIQIGGGNLAAFKPHFNYSVGEYVDSERSFKRALHNKSIDNSLQTGLDHHYEMIDPGELRRQEPKSDTQILETSAAAHSKYGVGAM